VLDLQATEELEEIERLELSRLLHPTAFKAVALPLDYISILFFGRKHWTPTR